MTEEQELYDEFGNYVGPDLDSSDDEDDSDDGDSSDASAASTASSLSYQHEDNRELATATTHQEDRNNITTVGTPLLSSLSSSTAVVLHEDKVHYPSAEVVYGADVHAVTLDEDAMELDTPIVEPVKTRHFSLVDDVATNRTRSSRHGGKAMGHDTDRDGTVPINNNKGDRDDDDVVSDAYLTALLSNESRHVNPRRCVALVGHLHAGKTSFVDELVASTKTTTTRGSRHNKHTTAPRVTDTLLCEQDRGLSVKSCPITLPLKDHAKRKTRLVTVLDTPGHLNFHDEAVASLRSADGAVLCVDACEGVRMGTHLVLKQAIAEGLPLVLLLNKVDRLLLELRLPPKDCHFKLRHIVEELNVLVEQYSGGRYGSDYFDPSGRGSGSASGSAITQCNVCFASSEHGWSFTCPQMASLYTDIMYYSDDGEGFSDTMTTDDFAKCLWGDYYVHTDDEEEGKKTIRTSANVAHSRCFVEYILDPIYKVYAACLGDKPDDVHTMLQEIGIHLSQDVRDGSARVLMRAALRRFFFDEGDSSGTGFVDCLIHRVPTPASASPAKVARCYTGPQNSDVARSMARCDPRGPLMVHITKLYAGPDGQTFGAFGRVYSGTVRPGDRVKILGEAYSPDDEEDVSYATVSVVSVPRGRRRTEVTMAKAGNWVILDGIDGTIAKTATVTHAEDNGSNNGNGKTPLVPHADLYIFKPLTFPHAGHEAVVKLSVEPLNPAELPKLVEGLRRVNRSYPMSKTKVEESGEHILYGTGELYLDCILHDLRHVYSSIEVKVADPVVAFRETIVETSAVKCFCDTSNRRNRLTVIAEPLEDGLAERLETGKIKIGTTSGSGIHSGWDNKKLGRFFQTNYSWDILSSRSVWAFGPSPTSGPNILLDDTLPSETNKDMLNSIKPSILQGFQWATREGPLCEEPVRATKVKLLDAMMADRPIHRGGGQIIPTARRVVHSAFLTGVPRLMEPVYDLQISCPADINLQPLLNKRRGHLVSSNVAIPGSPLSIVRAYLPVMDSFGFETDVRTYTQGQAMVSSVFDHWAVVPGDPMDRSIVLHPLEPSPPMALAREFLVKTRRRKGLSEDVSVTKFLDEGMRAKLLEMESM